MTPALSWPGTPTRWPVQSLRNPFIRFAKRVSKWSAARPGRTCNVGRKPTTVYPHERYCPGGDFWPGTEFDLRIAGIPTPKINGAAARLEYSRNSVRSSQRPERSASKLDPRDAGDG